MKGTRPLTNEEIIKVAECFEGKFEVRNRSIFMLGVSCGARISELLALTIGDVWQNGKPVTDIQFSKHIVKGKEHARAVPLNIDGRTAIGQLIAWYKNKFADHAYIDPEAPLFKSRVGGKPLTRKGAADVLSEVFIKAGLNGKLATHSLRKSFAQRLYNITGDIFIVKEMLGHQSTTTTQKYLGVDYTYVKEAVELIAITCKKQRNMTPIFKATDDELLLEMVKRGYRVEKRGETENSRTI